MFARRFKLAMVGGGAGSFIGTVHRQASELDNRFELVAGAFSSSARKSRAFARELGLDSRRAYGSYQELIDRELQLSDTERVDLVCIVTPNDLHFPVAKASLQAGFHVVCDKPMTTTVDEARVLKRIVRKSGRVFALTHNYTGYPMVKLARDLIRRGDLGTIRKVVVHYRQGWMTTHRGKQRLKTWRNDPARVGGAGALGDIGTHAENLAEYVTGLRIGHLCADLTAFTPKVNVDDDCSVLLRFNNGAKGVLIASRIAAGEKNGLSISVYGENAGLEWRQENPNRLRVMPSDGPEQIWTPGTPAIQKISPAAHRATRLPAGHPEGFIEAFANLYKNIADTIAAHERGEGPPEEVTDFPTAEDGQRGVQFIQTVLKSDQSNQKWTPMPRK